MIMQVKTFEFGDLKGSIYSFEFKDDELPTHEHDENTNHISIIARGSFKCIGRPEIEGQIIKNGQVVDWEANEPHGFIALEDNSRMIQIQKKYQKSP